MTRRIIAALFAVASLTACAATPASAACYKHYFRDGTWVWECR